MPRRTGAPNSMQFEHVAIYSVVVLYKCRVANSQTCADLLQQTSPPITGSVLLYDNSPDAAGNEIPPGWLFQADSQNGGLSKAYNVAIEAAKLKGCSWLLLLDQDTCLPKTFLANLYDKIALAMSYPDVVAIVPILKAGDRQISPFYPRLVSDVLVTERDTVLTPWIMAFNSATCVRINFIEDIGGFCRDLWLDYLDHWLFRTIHAHGKSVYVGNLEVQHDLSVENMNSVSARRYKNILAAELLFTNYYLPLRWRLALPLRLFARSIKHFIVTRDKRMAACMFRAVLTQIGSLIRLALGLADRQPSSRNDTHA